MELREIKNREAWEGFLSEVKDKTFLQSWSWGEFQISLGKNVWRYGVYEADVLISVFLIEKVCAKRGRFLLIPHGPCVKREFKRYRDLLLFMTRKLKKLGEREGASFIRLCPIWPRDKDEAFNDSGLRGAPMHNHPESSWVLDIASSEEDLLLGMRKNTRYNVRKGMNDSKIQIREGGEEELELFCKMHKDTSRRHGFVPFSVEYLKKEFNAFKENDEIKLYVAEYDGEVVGMAFIIMWSGVGFYHHAVLDPKYNRYPLSYATLWTAILECKKRGFELFDFWGYADPQSKHPWAGPTLFKMGFGGYRKEHVKTRDLVISPLYWLNYGIERFRRIKRGF